MNDTEQQLLLVIEHCLLWIQLNVYINDGDDYMCDKVYWPSCRQVWRSFLLYQTE